jgi:hypothetical protein
LNAIEHGTKKEERNINVARQDLEREQSNISKQAYGKTGRQSRHAIGQHQGKSRNRIAQGSSAGSRQPGSFFIFFVCSLV